MKERLDRWIRRHPLRVGGVSLSRLLARIAGRFLDVRVMGLAAEMTFYAVLSLIPLLGAMGASLGFLERFIGPAETLRVEAAIILALETIFSQEATTEVITPLVQGLLRQERAGFALGGFLVSLFFASRVFRSAIDTLDSAYSVEERRGTVAVWTLGFAFSVGAVVVGTLVLSMVVVGPLLGGGHAIAGRLRLGTVYQVAWAVARWPAVFAIGAAFLALFYRAGPNVRNTWRQSLPGAVFGMAGLLIVALGLRYYLQLTGLQSPEIEDADDAVAVALQVIGALMAALFWIWLSSIVLLTGGVVNAEVSAQRGESPPPQA